MPYRERDSLHRHLRGWIKDLEQSGLGERTLDLYGYWVEEAFRVIGPQDPGKVTKQDLAKITLGMGGNRNTLAVKLRMVRVFLRWCGCKDAAKWRINYTQQPKIGGVFMSEHQVAMCRESAERLGPVHAVLFALGADMGLRPIDICRLTLTNADEFLSQNGSMIRGKGRNGGKVAWQKANRYAKQYIERYLELRQTQFPGGTMFLMWKGKNGPRPMNPVDVRKRIAEVSAASGMTFHPHDLRRTFGHRLWEQGVELETICLLMRHDSPDTTFKAYIGVTEDRLSAAMDKLAPRPLSQSR